MKGYYIKIVLITLIVMISLLYLTDHLVISCIVTFVICFILLYGYNVYLLIKTSLILDNDCDPVEFLELNEKLKRLSSKSLKSNYLYGINEAAGLISLGDFSKAKEILLAIDNVYQSKNKVFVLIYNLNLATCLYELGEISKAEEIFESEIITFSTQNEKINNAIEMLKAERLFFLNKLEESKERFNQILNKKNSKRRKMAISFKLAQIEEKIGDREQANIMYAEVAENGGQLWIAKQAKYKLSE